MEEGGVVVQHQPTEDELVELKELLERQETALILKRWPGLTPLQVIQAVGTSVLDQVHIPTDVATVTQPW